MSNLSTETDKIIAYYKRGMDDGAEPLIRSMPVLIRRIEELERALIPFARQGLKDNHGLPLIQVYHKDCLNAFKSLSSAAAEAAKPAEPEYLPAEA